MEVSLAHVAQSRQEPARLATAGRTTPREGTDAPRVSHAARRERNKCAVSPVGGVNEKDTPLFPVADGARDWRMRGTDMPRSRCGLTDGRPTCGTDVPRNRCAARAGPRRRDSKREQIRRRRGRPPEAAGGRNRRAASTGLCRARGTGVPRNGCAAHRGGPNETNRCREPIRTSGGCPGGTDAPRNGYVAPPTRRRNGKREQMRRRTEPAPSGGREEPQPGSGHGTALTARNKHAAPPSPRRHQGVYSCTP